VNVGPLSNAGDPTPMVIREAKGQLDISGSPAELNRDR
jgi:hypothetical protein